MAKRPATGANAVTAPTGQGGIIHAAVPSHGAASGFSGIGAAGESDDTTLLPATRNSKGFPTGTTSFAGGANS